VKSTTPGEDLDIITGAFRARLAAAAATSTDWTDALDRAPAARHGHVRDRGADHISTDLSINNDGLPPGGGPLQPARG
jgi:hypothetical protein